MRRDHSRQAAIDAKLVSRGLICHESPRHHLNSHAARQTIRDLCVHRGALLAHSTQLSVTLKQYFTTVTGYCPGVDRRAPPPYLFRHTALPRCTSRVDLRNVLLILGT